MHLIEILWYIHSFAVKLLSVGIEGIERETQSKQLHLMVFENNY